MNIDDQLSGSTRNQPVADADWLELKAEIEREVDLVESSIQLGDQQLCWLRVGNPDVLLEKAVAANDEQAESWDPFWAATWRAAQGLDRFLAKLDLQGARVLELGCGSGQAGVGAALRGAHVICTDCVPLALKVARLNAWPVRERMQFQLLSWGRDAYLQERFSVILGSDLVYDPNLFPALEVCARKHLQRGGKWYVSEPHRHTGDRFSTWIREAGWHSLEHDVHLDDSRVPIRIFECWLPE